MRKFLKWAYAFAKENIFGSGTMSETDRSQRPTPCTFCHQLVGHSENCRNKGPQCAAPNFWPAYTDDISECEDFKAGTNDGN